MSGMADFEMGMHGSAQIYVLGVGFMSKQLLKYLLNKFGIKQLDPTIDKSKIWPLAQTGFAPLKNGAFGFPPCRKGGGANGNNN